MEKKSQRAEKEKQVAFKKNKGYSFPYEKLEKTVGNVVTSMHRITLPVFEEASNARDKQGFCIIQHNEADLFDQEKAIQFFRIPDEFFDEQGLLFQGTKFQDIVEKWETEHPGLYIQVVTKKAELMAEREYY